MFIVLAIYQDKKKKYEPPIPTRVGKKQKKAKGPDAANKLPQGKDICITFRLNFFRVLTTYSAYNKQLLDEVFVISRIIKVLVRVMIRSRRLQLITLTETLIPMCGSRKYPYPSPLPPPHGGSRNFLGVEGSKREHFRRGGGYIRSFSRCF